MKQKFKNSRQKVQTNSGAIRKLFNALVLNFCNNPLGLLSILAYNFRKIIGDIKSIPLNFSLFSGKIGLVANYYKSQLAVSKWQ